MGFRFQGILAVRDDEVGRRAVEKWPFCRFRHIDVPFSGIGVKCPDSEASRSKEEFDEIEGRNYLVENELPDFTREFPDVRFLYVNADCFGGNCMYDGYCVRNGEIYLKIECRKTGRESLIELLDGIGVSISGDGFFELFTRGYW